MSIWKDCAKSALDCARGLADGINQKHRRAAELNRLRTVIRCRERAAQREYLALGRYYYNALRDRENSIAEEHCKRLDGINKELDGTLETLERSVRAMDAEVVCTVAGTDTAEVEEIDLSDVESFDHDPFPSAAPSPMDSPEPEPGDFSPLAAEEKPEDNKPRFSGAELTENDSLPFEG